MESISIAKKILQDSTGYYAKMLWNPYRQQTRSYKILQDPTRSYKILRDTRKNGMESISIANKILQDPTRFYGILHKNAMESISISNKILQDSSDT